MAKPNSETDSEKAGAQEPIEKSRFGSLGHLKKPGYFTIKTLTNMEVFGGLVVYYFVEVRPTFWEWFHGNLHTLRFIILV